jgi:glycosyltransferase involved in cell wall biosynthesis
MISVIATVYNEGKSICRLLDSLAAQTRPPDEIVIVDGGSTDDTVSTMHTYADRLPLRVINAPGVNISEGRNRAAAAATGDILAITDAGVSLQNNWLEQITAPFAGENPPDVVGGFFVADPHTIFEAAMGATVLPHSDEIDPATFLPSSRSIAVQRAAFERVGGYPEWLDYCEDLIFDLRLKQDARFAFVPDARVAFRPRESLRAFFKQYYLYARGDGKADLWRKRHLIRYLTYLIGLPTLVTLGLRGNPLGWVLLALGGIIYTRRPYTRLRHVLHEYGKTRPVSPWGIAYAVILVPLIRVVGDIAKMIGYPMGWRWRLRERPPNWREH